MNHYVSFVVFGVIFWIMYLRAAIISLPRRSGFSNFTELNNRNFKVFWVKAESAAKIGLFSEQNDSSLVYELTFGGVGNTISKIRYGKVQEEIFFEGALLFHGDYFHSRWVQWTNFTIFVGSGTIPGQNIEMNLTRVETESIRYVAARGHTRPLQAIFHLSCSKIPLDI